MIAAKWQHLNVCGVDVAMCPRVNDAISMWHNHTKVRDVICMWHKHICKWNKPWHNRGRTCCSVYGFFSGAMVLFFVAIFLDARFQKCLIFVKELLSWLVKWHHWLAHQCHAVCWRHVFRLTQIAWNPSGVLNSTWYLVLPVNGKLSKAVLSSYLWKRPIILNTTAYLSIVCILL